VRLPAPARRSRRPLLIGGGVGLALVVVALVLALVSARHSPNASAGPVAAAPPANNPSPPQPTPAQPTPPLALRADEKVLYRLNLERQQPFLSRIVRHEHSAATYFPDGWRGQCWKDESVGEVLAERVGGSMALGFRNLSGTPACQLWTNLYGAIAQLKPGRQYALRVEYQAPQEAAASVLVRRSDYSEIASGALPPTGGRWAVVEVPFSQEAEEARDVCFVTAANGPQTTVFVRSVLLVERRQLD
jgi:hypothetical protein